MSDTPRTDAYYENWQESWSREPINLDLCRQLERELAEARKQRDIWKANHDNQVVINRALRNRPDMGERARLVDELIKQGDALAEAAQAVVDRWDSPTWKGLEPTAEFINALRNALVNTKGGQHDA
jgi:hypothetical protein